MKTFEVWEEGESLVPHEIGANDPREAALRYALDELSANTTLRGATLYVRDVGTDETVRVRVKSALTYEAALVDDLPRRVPGRDES